MKRIARYILILSLLSFLILFWLTRGQWISSISVINPLITDYLKDNSEIIQTIDSVINIVGVLWNLMLTIINFIIWKPKNTFELKDPPLRNISIEQLLAYLGQYGGQVPWIDRGLVNISQLQRSARIVIVGPMKIGKTREAIELIRKAINYDLITSKRIFQPSPIFRYIDALVLPRIINSTIDLQESLLLFLDDLPHLYFKEGLSLLDITIDSLKTSKDLYIIATAKTDELSEEHYRWFKKHKFEVVKLTQLSKSQIGLFIDSAASKFKISIDNDAKEILVNRSNGSVEIVLTAIRRILSEKISHVNHDTASSVTFHSYRDTWLSTRRYIEGKKPATKFILQSLSSFRTALISPYPPIVLSYANYLWAKTEKNRFRLGRSKALIDALNYLQLFDFNLASGVMFFPENLVETNGNYENAKKELGEFLLRPLQIIWKRSIRNFSPNSFLHTLCLIDIGMNSQRKAEYGEAVKYYTAALKIFEIPWVFINRGSAYGELGDTKLAMNDINRAASISVSKDDQLEIMLYHNKSVAYIEIGNLDKAIENVREGLAKYPDQFTLIGDRGTINSLKGANQDALKDLSYAIDEAPDGIDKAFYYQARGNVYKGQKIFALAIKDFNTGIQMFPDIPKKASLYHSRGDLYFINGQFQNAINDFNKAIGLNPNSAPLYFYRADAYTKLKKIDKALTDFTSAYRIDPSFTMAYLGKAEILFTLGDYPHAIEEINNAISTCTNNELLSISLTRRGLIQEANTNIEKAITDIEKAISINSNYLYARFQRARILLNRGNYDEVITECTKIVDMDSSEENKIEVLNTRGSAYDELGHFDKAIVDFRSAISLFGSTVDIKTKAKIYMNYGITLYKMEKFEEAENCLDKAISIDSQLWEAYVNRSSIYLKQKKYREAVQDLSKAIPHLPNGSTKAAAFLQRGNAYIFMNKYEMANKDLSTAIILYENDLEKYICYFRRAISNSLIGNMKEAIADVNNCIRINPTYGRAYLFRGNCYIKSEQIDEAIKEFSRAIDCDTGIDLTEKVEAYNKRGIHTSDKGMFFAALNDFDKAISLDKENYVLYFHRGTHYLLFGKYIEAIANFDQAISIHSEYPQAYHNRGIAYSNLPDFEKAIDDLKKSILFFDGNVESAGPLRNLAIVLTRLGIKDEAEEALKKAEIIAPNEISTVGSKIQIEYFKGNFSNALDLIEIAESSFPDFHHFDFWKGILLFCLGRQTEAIIRIRKNLTFDVPIINLNMILSQLEDIKSKGYSSCELDEAINLVRSQIKLR